MNCKELVDIRASGLLVASAIPGVLGKNRRVFPNASRDFTVWYSETTNSSIIEQNGRR